MKKEDRIKQLSEATMKMFEESAKKYPDVKILLDDYSILKKEENSRFTPEFLDGYLSCISDLIITKKMI